MYRRNIRLRSSLTLRNGTRFISELRRWVKTLWWSTSCSLWLLSRAPGPRRGSCWLRTQSRSQHFVSWDSCCCFWCSCWCGVSGFSWTPTAACRPHPGLILKTVWRGDSSITHSSRNTTISQNLSRTYSTSKSKSSFFKTILL